MQIVITLHFEVKDQLIKYVFKTNIFMFYVTFFWIKVCPKFGHRNIRVVVRGGTAGGSSESCFQ